VLWVVVWTVLVLAAAVVLFLVGRSVVRKGLVVLREAGEASRQLDTLNAELARLQRPAAQEDPAVLADPVDLRRRRDQAVRARRRARAVAARRRTPGRPARR
jgi:hypothetical protein